MIRIQCHCQHVMDVPDDQAGLSIQCSQCGRLLDVPLLGELDHIDPDGTYKLDSREIAPPNKDLDVLTSVYYPGRTTAAGVEIDLRGPVKGADAIGDSALAPESGRPRYDPVTGELIQPLGIHSESKVPQDVSNLPVAKRVINYGSHAPPMEVIPIGFSVFASLLLPVNLLVMGIMLLLHLGLMATTWVTLMLPFTFLAPLVLLLLVVGHYAAVVDETGPTQRDELPRPLRDVNLYDDLWAPFCHMFSSWVLCYWPVFWLSVNGFMKLIGLPQLVVLAPQITWPLLLGVGSLFFPAVLLTVSTSGTILNLRPDRVLGTIFCIGWRYLFLAILWVMGGGCLVAGQLGVWGVKLNTPYMAHVSTMLMLIAGIYLMHALCWLLGLEYRRHLEDFPWVLQRHTRKIQPPTQESKVSAEPAKKESAAPPKTGKSPGEIR